MTATLKLPAAVGAPERAPVEASSESPAGKPLADRLIGAVPPLAPNVALKAEPT